MCFEMSLVVTFMCAKRKGLLKFVVKLKLVLLHSHCTGRDSFAWNVAAGRSDE